MRVEVGGPTETIDGWMDGWMDGFQDSPRKFKFKLGFFFLFIIFTKLQINVSFMRRLAYKSQRLHSFIDRRPLKLYNLDRH